MRIDDDDAEDATQSPGASGSGAVSQTATSSLHQLVVEGKVVKKTETSSIELQEVKKSMDEIMGVGETEEVERAVELARKSGSASALIEALESKVKLLVSSSRQCPEHTVINSAVRNQHASLPRHRCCAGSV